MFFGVFGINTSFLAGKNSGKDFITPVTSKL